MLAKIQLDNDRSVYEINATLVADHRAKKIAKKHADPMIIAYSITYSEVFDEALASEQILGEWIKSSMTWENIQANAHLISGEKTVPDLKTVKLTFIPKAEPATK